MTYEKKRLVLFQQLQGGGYFDALAAFHFAEKYHTGTRKDGVTPEFEHQIDIALFALLLPDLMDREAVLATIALHDIREDYGISHNEIVEIFSCPLLATKVGLAVEAMTKKFRGRVKDPKDVFAAIAADPIASIAKACDRQHNICSMVGVFTFAKQRSYLAEVRDLFLPMLKEAKKNFPRQIRAYELLKFNLETQCELIQAGLNASNENTAR